LLRWRSARIFVESNSSFEKVAILVSPENHGHFVTSMPAPVASGWSGCRVGLAPTGKRRLARRTGHATTDTDIR
jgi:hypothetical protein